MSRPSLVRACVRMRTPWKANPGPNLGQCSGLWASVGQLRLGRWKAKVLVS